jgi:hypothetical protein
MISASLPIPKLINIKTSLEHIVDYYAHIGFNAHPSAWILREN